MLKKGDSSFKKKVSIVRRKIFIVQYFEKKSQYSMLIKKKIIVQYFEKGIVQYLEKNVRIPQGQKEASVLYILKVH